MAQLVDNKITRHTETTTLDDTDILYVLKNPSSTKDDRKITGANLKTSIARERLTADRTYYVRTDGSDGNTGLVNSSGGAFLTIGKATTIAKTIDLNGYSLTIKVGSGTYTPAVTLPWLLGGVGIFEGDTTTPSNCLISTTSADAVTLAAYSSWTVRGFKTTTTTSGNHLVAGVNADLTLGAWDFGAAATNYSHIFARVGSSVYCQTNYSITGGALAHLSLTGFVKFEQLVNTVTLSGTPAFTIFLNSNNSASSFYSVTYSGSATGSRYYIAQFSAVQTFGAGASFLPGNSAGSNDGTSVYA